MFSIVHLRCHIENPSIMDRDLLGRNNLSSDTQIKQFEKLQLEKITPLKETGFKTINEGNQTRD